jgi:hypothetical protein
MPKPDTFSVKKCLKALSGITYALIQQALFIESDRHSVRNGKFRGVMVNFIAVPDGRYSAPK